MSCWQPIHEHHAIDVMAAVVTFAQPVPDIALRRMLRAAEDILPAGLRSRHSTQSLQLVVAPQGISTTGPAGGLHGVLFNALFEDDDGTPTPGRVAEQFQVDATSIVYRTWRYVSWSWQVERMRSLMTAPLAIARDVASIGMARLEYLDRFWFEGEPQEAITSELLRVDCPALAPHIFERKDLWHVHTGAFLTPDPLKRLQLVLVDALNAPAPGQAAGPAKRWVNITTALEDRFPAETLDDPRENADFPFGLFADMHADLKDVLGSIITSNSAARIYLSDSRHDAP